MSLINNVLENEALIICTFNRQQQLNSTLTYVSLAKKLPEILILCHSGSFDANQINSSHLNRFKERIFIQSAISSLPYQRNLALKKIPKTIQIIHFIDDDFEPDSNYFSELSAFIKSNPNCSGVGGKILPESQQQLTWYSKIFLLDSNKAGRILKSGRTVEPQANHYLDNPFSTQFLSGCSMSFKSSSIRTKVFDENLLGYAQDEDLAFCLQFKSESLFVNPMAFGYHRKSDDSRLSSFEFKKMSVINRYYVMNTYYKHGFSRFLFLWSHLGQLIALIVSHKSSKDLIFGQIHGLIFVLKQLLARK